MLDFLPLIIHSAREMAVSPLVPQSPSVTASSSAASLKVKEISTQNKLNGPGASHPSAPLRDSGRELAQQLNDEVRHKYIKGTFFCFLRRFLSMKG